MKRIVPGRRLVTSLVIAGFIALLPAQLLALPRQGQPAPAFKVVTTSGQAVSLDNYQGYVLVIDFFATWCQPCRMSIPHLVKMNQKYGKQGLQILGLSADEDGQLAVKSFSAEHHINYPVALAGDTLTDEFGVRSVPVMIVIDKKGKVAEVFRGFSDEIAASMESLVKKLLAER
jgi:cytochrome c biogenesis protein CcmG, thiol:disulfide interchange protein DsbE